MCECPDSLPSLRPLMDINYLPLTDMRIARTFCFTNGGQALYLSSPTEIQRITYSQETCDNLQVRAVALFSNRPPSRRTRTPRQLFPRARFPSANAWWGRTATPTMWTCGVLAFAQQAPLSPPSVGPSEGNVTLVTAASTSSSLIAWSHENIHTHRCIYFLKKWK